MIFTILPLLYITITLFLVEQINFAKSLAFTLLIFIGALILEIKERRKSIELMLFLLFNCFYVVSILINKQDFRTALLGADYRNMGLLLHLSLLIFLYLSVNSIINEKHLFKYGLWPIVMLTLGYGIIQVVGFDPLVWGETDKVVLFLGNSNYAAQLLALLVAVPFILVLRTGSYLSKSFGITCIFVLFFLGVKTETLQFYVLVLASLVSFAIFQYWDLLIKNLRLILLVCSGFLVASFISLLIKLESIISIYKTNFIDRIDINLTGIRIFKDNILFGIGIEQFARYEPQYRSIEQSLRNGNTSVPDKAHNVFIEHFVGGGVFTGLSFTLFIFATLLAIIRLAKSRIDFRQRIPYAILSSIWFTYIVSLFISTDMIFIMIISYVSLGLILQKYLSSYVWAEKSFAKWIPKIYLPKYVISLLALLTILVGSFSASNSYKWKQIESGKITDGDEIIEIVREYPREVEVEKFVVSAFQNLSNCPFILKASDSLIAFNPRSGQGYYFKSICEDYAGRRIASLESIRQAVMYQPLNTYYLDSLVRLSHALGETALTDSSLRRLESIDPKYPGLKSLREFIGITSK